MGEVLMGGEARRLLAEQLADALARLRGAAAPGGWVDAEQFAQEAHRLGLVSEQHREGLRAGLEQCGVRVRAAVPDAGGRTAQPPVERVARARSDLRRHARPDGSVTAHSVAGVARLHALAPSEARALAAEFEVSPSPSPRAAGGRGRSGAPRRVAPAASSIERCADVPAGTALVEPLGDLGAAVRAARAVLDGERRRRSSAKRLLTAEEEVGLAVLLRGVGSPLGRDVPSGEIARLPRHGERWRAYESLARHNEGLVRSIAYRFEGRGLESEDLVQHGTIGLLRALRKFDVTQGYKLSTYASWWIRQAVSRAVADEGTAIRLPVHFHEKVSKVAAAERALSRRGQPATDVAVAVYCDLSLTEVEQVRRLSRATDSLERIVDSDPEFADIVLGPSSLPGPDAVSLGRVLFEQVRDVLDTFTEREVHVLVARMGLDGERDTLDDIGTVFGVTRERIRQIEKKVKPVFRDRLAAAGVRP